MPVKRGADSMALVPAKKQKHEMVVVGNRSKAVATTGPPRCSNLDSPIMLLSGHKGEIHSARFHPSGNWLASAGMERIIYLWEVYGECANVSLMTGHSGAIMQLVFSQDGDTIFTASTDKTVGIFDTMTGGRIKRLKGHTGMVNSVGIARNDRPLLVSGSDDCSVKVWDRRQKNPVHNFDSNYQVTSVAMSADGQRVMSGGIDNDVKLWDLRKAALETTITGHTDTVTGMSLSPDGSYLLTNSMDSSLRIWDIRPFCPGDRCMTMLRGHSHNFEKNLLKCNWSPDGTMVSAGSSDRNVYIWNIASRKIMYKLPGHLGSVNECDFHNVEPIILSAGSDKQIFLGEFEP